MQFRLPINDKTSEVIAECVEIAVRYIKNAPTIDAVEVVHGKWISYESDETYGPYDSKEWYKCSECGKDAYGRCYEDEWYSSPILSDYCHNCGADMRCNENG
jgi:hypothetical protein